ncbi:Abhydrolase-3 domain-containing protein [Favolaschia claudopus]|uniref:Abhydrolase-3 domain-containing protein n=1 Tax=Favolaschia claudopus TaxID=2862362 RepID=A0AAW0DRA3_9AGAR
MPSLSSTKYGQLSWLETFGMFASVIPLPISIIWSVVTSAYASYNKTRSLKRIASDTIMRHMLGRLSVPQLQAIVGTTMTAYEKFCRANNLPLIIDELGEDARLLWLGPKRLEHVVLYIHGGGFILAPGDTALEFWRRSQQELNKQNIEVSIVMLNYSLIPDASFPTPLRQAALAIEFLITAGVKPQNLQLVGDSAGGNLVLQVLSHMLHPLGSVPEIRLATPLRGILLISPWTTLSATNKPLSSYTENEGRDCVTQRIFSRWGALVLADVVQADRPFVEAVHAPDTWFEGADTLVERVLITGGGLEVLRDDIIAVGQSFQRHHRGAELVVQEDGIHDDMFNELAVNERKCSLTPLIIGWLATGFRTDNTN